MRLSARMLVCALALSAWTGAALAGPVTGVDVIMATVMQQKQSSFSGLGLRMRIHPPQLIQQITLMPTIEYWRNRSNLDPFDIETTRRDATLGFDARYDFDQGGWHPYVGLGYGLHFLSAEVDAPTYGLNNASDSLIKGGVSVLGGLTFGLAGRLNNVIELKYHHIPDQSQLKFNWGLAIDL